MSNFHNLIVKEVKKQTTDSVSVSFTIPADSADSFKFEAGQYITLEKEIKGKKIRRAYSIWKAPFENEISVLIKQVENGKFSTYANNILKNGDEIAVMSPAGNFKKAQQLNKKQTFFAAGSGITPVISIIKQELKTTEGAQIELFYSNKTANDVIFKEELLEIKEKHSSSFTIHNLYSREKTQDEIFYGRIDKQKCSDLLSEKILDVNSGGYYLCGPENMILAIKETLISKGVNKNNIHFELFTASGESNEIKEAVEEVKISVTIDDDEFEYEYNTKHSDSLLDAGIENGIDFPFSCKGGVCCTCRAKVMKGKAEMKMNYALTEQEVTDGFILTCQAHPLTPELTISFDE
jgi:ring-1,2-phenylacetyl-CoA epoxidase subunit PaaE